MKAFTSVPASTVNIDVSSSSQRVAIPNAGSSSAIRLHNDGTATVWVKFGKSDVAADADEDVPVGPGVCEVSYAANEDCSPLYAAAIAAGSTGKIYFTPGEGI